MAARRMAAEIEAVARQPELLGVAPEPDDRRAHLRRDDRDAAVRAEIVVEEGDVGAMRDERLGDEAVDRLVATLPVAAVDIDQQRRARLAAAEEIDALAGRRAVGEVEPAAGLVAESGAPRDPALADLVEIGTVLAHVVFALERRLVELRFGWHARSLPP